MEGQTALVVGKLIQTGGCERLLFVFAGQVGGRGGEICEVRKVEL